MYKTNDYKFGFFVKRDNWENTLAKVVSIEGVEEGKPIKGKQPYFGNPEVKAEFYKTSNIDECTPKNLDNTSVLSGAGNYSYSLVLPPLSVFEKLSRELMKYLAENHHPHTSILITSNTAELLEGKACIATDEYLKD